MSYTFDHFPTASLRNLAAMSGLLNRIRAFFESRSFIEVLTPVLSQDTVVNRYLEPIPVSIERQPNRFQTFFLQTSPEYSMKRLVAAGAKAIYQIAHAFRSGDLGSLHNVEFTLLEWYRVGDDYHEGIQFLSDFAEEIFKRGNVEKTSFYDGFFRFTGINPHTASCDQMRNFADDNRIPYPESYGSAPRRTNMPDDFQREPWVDLLFSEVVQANLGRERPMILYDFPVWQSQLATTRSEKCGEETFEVSERFELYVDGVELANGYHELTDAAELSRRNRETNQYRVADGNAPLPESSRLIQAMESGFPPCCGTALGVERLLMVLLEADSIEDVMPFPLDRA